MKITLLIYLDSGKMYLVRYLMPLHKQTTGIYLEETRKYSYVGPTVPRINKISWHLHGKIQSL